MWRVAACYLVFKNGTEEDVNRAARALGIPTADCVCENPLRYAVIYILGICGSVWFSVTMSAILFDWAHGHGFVEGLGQSTDLVTRWVAFSPRLGRSIAIGLNALASKDAGVAIGAGASSTGPDAIAIEPERRGDEQKLADALHKLLAEDPW